MQTAMIASLLLLAVFPSEPVDGRSSRQNHDIIAGPYADDPVQRWVAHNWGDEIPRMRDDLIRRKEEGEGMVQRHLNAWTTLDNWKVDSDNDRKEDEDSMGWWESGK